MPLVVYKYPAPSGPFKVSLPKGAKILTVQVQFNQPQMWVLVNPDMETETRYFGSVPTGLPFDDTRADHIEYIGTFQLHDGSLVFHLLEFKD